MKKLFLVFLPILMFCVPVVFAESFFAESFEETKKLAEQGDSSAQFSLGSMYYKGYGDEENHTEAVKWLNKALEQGHRYAELELNLIYQFEENKQKAERGDIKAQNWLGNHYALGVPMKRDYQESVKWFKKAAEQGDTNAMVDVGGLYYSYVKPADYEESFKWYKKAAEQGNARVFYKLGTMYAVGEGVEQSYQEAFKWMKNAVDSDYDYGRPNDFVPLQKELDSQYILGNDYAEGKGVKQDYKKAFELMKEVIDRDLWIGNYEDLWADED